jgi:uncharacterized protein
MLSFLNRHEEQDRLRRLLARREGSLGVLYGRRRCGKSRLLREILPAHPAIYYVGDDRENALQRAAVAAEISRLLPGFDRVTYPDWDALCARFWDTAPKGTVLIFDEFPALVATGPELPSVLQKYLDRYSERGLHLLLTGSSQRMMQGLVLDRSAPLFGRASEILKIPPLAAGWIRLWGSALQQKQLKLMRCGAALLAIGSSPKITRASNLLCATWSSARSACCTRSPRVGCSTTCATPRKQRRFSA